MQPRKGYKNKSHALASVAREKLKALGKLQTEQDFLRRKGSVLELLLEVASEIVVHKRKHTGTRFTPLEDAELVSFLDTFLQDYGGYTAERPTANSLFELSKLNVQESQEMTSKAFTEQYTSLVQRLSLLLLQAADDSMMGDLMSAVQDLKHLLVGTLLWNPLLFMHVGAHHLVSGQPVVPDADHSTGTIAGVGLAADQEAVLSIIGDLYDAQISSLEASHANLSRVVGSDIAADNVGGCLAANIMKLNSNMARMLAMHQLYHVAVVVRLSDQQLAHLCVRCFPRFPCLRELLRVLSRMHAARNEEAAAAGGPAGASPLGPAAAAAAGLGASTAGSGSLLASDGPAGGASAAAGSSANWRPALSMQVQQHGGAAAAAAAVVVRDDASPSDPGGDANGAAPVAAGAAGVPQAAAREPPAASNASPADAEASRGGGSAGSPADQNGTKHSTQAGRGSRSPLAAQGSRSAKAASSKRPAPGGGPGSVGAVPSAPGSKRSRTSDSDRWGQPQQQHYAAGQHYMRAAHGAHHDAAAAEAAAGALLDPAAAAALPVPLPSSQLQPYARGSSAPASSAIPPQLMRQLVAALNSAGGAAGVQAVLAAHPRLAVLLQQQPQLMAVVQEALQQQHGGADASSAAALAAPHPQAGGAAAAAHRQGLHAHPDAPASRGTASHPLQALLESVAGLMKAVTAVSDAAAAAAEAGHGNATASAVSAAEAAMTAAAKSMQGISARCLATANGCSSGAAEHQQQQHQQHNHHHHHGHHAHNSSSTIYLPPASAAAPAVNGHHHMMPPPPDVQRAAAPAAQQQQHALSQHLAASLDALKQLPSLRSNPAASAAVAHLGQVLQQQLTKGGGLAQGAAAGALASISNMLLQQQHPGGKRPLPPRPAGSKQEPQDPAPGLAPSHLATRGGAPLPGGPSEGAGKPAPDAPGSAGAVAHAAGGAAATAPAAGGGGKNEKSPSAGSSSTISGVAGSRHPAAAGMERPNPGQQGSPHQQGQPGPRNGGIAAAAADLPSSRLTAIMHALQGTPAGSVGAAALASMLQSVAAAAAATGSPAHAALPAAGGAAAAQAGDCAEPEVDAASALEMLAVAASQQESQ